MTVTNMTLNILAAGLITVVLMTVIFLTSRNKKLDSSYFSKRWSILQKQCSNKKLWHLAIIDADKLLDEALKQRHFKGKTTGERLVSAQRDLSSNDSVWFGHKLKNKLTDNSKQPLTKRDTLAALAGFRQALKDLGAFLSDANKGFKE